MNKKIVSIYGYGRFGKFWGDILKDDFHVKTFSRRGLTKDDVSDGIEITSLEGLFNCDVMFFCVAISSFEDVLKATKHLHNPDTLYFDTCSVKVFPVEWMQKHLPEKSKIVATHPMFGPDSYPGKKDNLPMVMSNVRTNENIFNDWVRYFDNKNLRVEIMKPEEHDEMVAYSQGITHFIGRVLADLHLDTTKINTLGYYKLLEIIEQTCNDSWQLFEDLQRYNPFTIKMREDLHTSLEKIYTILNSIKK